MKIEVITLHNVRNYGSALQTYATQKVLKEKGNDVEFIDYYRNDIIEKNLLNRWINNSSFFSKNIITKITGRILLGKSIKKQSKVFNAFLGKYINVTPQKYYSNDEIKSNLPKADAYCTGSDQVWNGEWNQGLELPYFLDFLPEDANRFAYAASFGRKDISEEELNQMKPLLKKYKAISVRESSGVALLERMEINDSKHVLDPTLLLNKNEWNELSVPIKYKKYILVYQLNTKNKEFDNYVKNAAKYYKLPVIRVSNVIYQKFKYGKLVLCPTVQEFLSYFLNAEYVITDSFHGTAFSINLNKKFVSIFPNKFSERLSSILKLTSLEDRQITDFNNYEILSKTIDYDRVNKVLEDERNKSKSYIDFALNKCGDGKND